MPTETHRLSVLQSYGILDTPPEPQFDEVVQLARIVCAAPVSLVSLVEEERQWFKAAAGFDGCETPINQSVCAHAIREPEILIIPDLTKDDRTRANTLVTDGPQIRFYAGAVLRSPEGPALGALCVIDDKPRPDGLTPSQQAGLLALARQTMALLNYRRVLERRDDAVALSAQRTQGFVDAELAGGTGSFNIDVATDLISPSPEFCRIFGLPHCETMPASEVEALMIDDGSVRSTEFTRTDGTAPLKVEYRIRRQSDGEVRWIDRRGEFERDPEGKPIHFRGTVQDITDRKAMEAGQEILNRELSHRIKNTLAIVEAIATQTLRHVADRGAVEEFSKRILALGGAHDILLQQSWAGANLRSLIESAISPHGAAHRFRLSGPDLMIDSRSVLTVSLVLHELATNALKHGALSNGTGQVTIDWTIEDTGEKREFFLRWVETGGPPVAKPSRSGFGTRLIESGFGGASTARITYEPGGFQAVFRSTLQILASNSP